MDLFPVGSFVRLRSRGRENKYAHADEDGSGVSLRRLGAVPTLNTVWKVDLWATERGDILLLQGAAYGRYLAVANEDEAGAAPPGHRSVRAVQRDYTSPHVDGPFMWRAVRVQAGQNYVRLRNFQRYLRANGRHRYWKNRVTVAARNGDETTMMQWMVEAIPSAPDPLPLPPPPPPPPEPQPPIHVSRGLFRRRTRHNAHPNPGRIIRYARLDDDGNFVNDEDGEWPEFVFHDYSVSNLRTEVANLEGEENITLGVQAGWNALVIPLVTNLPNNVDPMLIIVYNIGSPAAEELTYPQL